MIREARRRAARGGLPVEFLAGRVEDIDLPAGHFDACRFERVLQHVPSPIAALREAARVLRAGGRVAAFEPDWTSLAITGASADVTDRILEARSRAFASPDVGAALPSILSEAGFVDVRPSELHLVTTTLDVALRAFRLEAGAEAAVTGGAISAAEAAGWLHALSAADQGGRLSRTPRRAPCHRDQAASRRRSNRSQSMTSTAHWADGHAQHPTAGDSPG
jgi:SAM-dependent methyltransferase